MFGGEATEDGGTLASRRSRKRKKKPKDVPAGPKMTAASLRGRKDGKDAHWNDNPLSIKIEKIEVTKSSKIDVNLASGGGVAISLLLKK